MRKTTIAINPFSPRSVRGAIAELERYKEKVEKAAEELPRVLAEIARDSAQATYNNAPYNIYTDGTFDSASISVDAVPTDDGYATTATGDEVTFVEFGAGVYYNGEEPYLGERPEGIVGIGEYGSGNGNKKAWGFPGIKKGVATHGTPASNAMYFAMRDAEDSIQAETEKLMGDK